MDIGSLIQNLLGNSVTATTIYGLVLLGFVDFATGITKAFSVPGDGIGGTSFRFVYFSDWAKTKATQLVNIIVVLLAGAAAPNFNILGFDVNPLTTLGVGWAATVALTAVGSITSNVKPSDKVAIPSEVAIAQGIKP